MAFPKFEVFLKQKPHLIHVNW